MHGLVWNVSFFVILIVAGQITGSFIRKTSRWKQGIFSIQIGNQDRKKLKFSFCKVCSVSSQISIFTLWWEKLIVWLIDIVLKWKTKAGMLKHKFSLIGAWIRCSLFFHNNHNYASPKMFYLLILLFFKWATLIFQRCSACTSYRQKIVFRDNNRQNIWGKL